MQTEKLASLGQLTAGIAHEIKNPLNFVNNFAALSVELIDELKDAIDSASQDGEQTAELMELLAGNLGKVVEHGKRANSIVKNMLLHSRADPGSAGLQTSMHSWRRVSISLITAHGPRSRVSTLPSSGHLIRLPAKLMCCPRGSPGYS